MEQPRCGECAAALAATDRYCPSCGTPSTTAETLRLATDHRADSGGAERLLAELRSELGASFQVVRELGHGGMGTVFLGRDPRLKRSVAIKVLNPSIGDDDSARTRFAREAEAAAAVEHPNVVKIYQVGVLEESRAPYFVMQYIEGETLQEVIARGVTSERQGARIIAAVADALAAAHARGLIHRDIKPANIMIERETGRAVVLDFGISAVAVRAASDLGPRLTQSGASIGTPAYMSPEQAAGGAVSDRTDIYSLGCVAFELLAARPPFRESSAWELMAAHIKVTAPSLREVRPDISHSLVRLVDSCLVKDPAMRPSARDITATLRPDAAAVMEWPPPGLDDLVGMGWELTRRALYVGVAWIVLLLLLAAAPSVAVGGKSGLGDTLWWLILNGPLLFAGKPIDGTECIVRALMGESCDDRAISAAPLWLALVTILGGLLLMTAAATVRSARRLTRALKRARAIGYPENLLVDVAWDTVQGSAALRNAAGPWAMVTADVRDRLLLRRRQRAMWVTGCAAATIALAVGFSLGLVSFGELGPRWLSVGYAFLLGVPVLFAPIGSHFLRAEERRVLGRPARAASGGADEAAGTAAVLAKVWIESGVTRDAHRAPRMMRRALLLRVPTIAAVISGVLAIPLVLLVQWMTGWHSSSAGQWRQDWIAHVATVDGRGKDSWLALDRSLAAEADLLRPRARDGGRSVGERTRPPMHSVRRYFPLLMRKTYDEESYLLATDTRWLWLDRWSSGVDSMLEAQREGREPPDSVLALLDAMANRAMIASDLAVERGDLPTARARVGELLAVARQELAMDSRLSVIWAALRALEVLRWAEADSAGLQRTEGLRRRVETHFLDYRLVYLGAV